MQCFWYVPTGQLWRVDYQRLEDQPDDAISNTTPQVTAMDGIPNCITSDLCMMPSVHRNLRLLLRAQLLFMMPLIGYCLLSLVQETDIWQVMQRYVQGHATELAAGTCTRPA